jgi:hypothetical protein
LKGEYHRLIKRSLLLKIRVLDMSIAKGTAQDVTSAYLYISNAAVGALPAPQDSGIVLSQT